MMTLSKQLFIRPLPATPEDYSILTRRVYMEMTAQDLPLFHVVDGDCLGHHVAMFPHDKETNQMLQWHPVDEWASKFAASDNKTQKQI